MARGGIPNFKNASTASWAVRDLNRAFNELATTGEVTYKTLSAMVGLITRMNPVLGALAEAAFLTYESFQLLKQQDIADSLIQISAGAKQLGLELDIAQGRAAAGAGQFSEVRVQLQKLAEIQVRVREELKGWDDAVEHHKELVKKGTETEAEATAQLQGQEAIRKEHILHLEEEADAIQRGLPLIREKATVLHTTLTEYEKIRLAALGAASTEQAFVGATIEGLDRYIKSNDKIIDDTIRRMALEEQAGKFAGESGLKLYATETGILDKVERTNAGLKAQVNTLQQVGQMASSALAGTATSAFDAYAGAMDHVISLNNLFSDSTGRAFRNAEAQVVKSLGQMATVHMLEELALAATTSLNPAAQALYGPPSVHLQAAAMWGAVAVAAGLGAAALSVNPGGGAGGGGGGGPNTPTGGDNLNINIVVIGALDDRQLEDLNNQMTAAQQSRRLI